MITKEKIIEVFNYYAVGSFNIQITEDNLKLFAKEIEALSQVNDVVLDGVIKCEHDWFENLDKIECCSECKTYRYV